MFAFSFNILIPFRPLPQMTPEEAKDKMDLMFKSVTTFWLPDGFEVSVSVPKEIADLTRAYYDSLAPFGKSGPFAAGEPFYYKGIRCFATPKPPQK